eukprot:TRINITY_DN1867_c0_g2_i3.p2 TRINITY_DN1867_c0_g2~~TRINITY_DN1867_c0_g2_i3.p2  ORF type:complete len:304 (+),score=76.57 TRINITY_DN1867_c0_g2_i3:479-1390(+)
MLQLSRLVGGCGHRVCHGCAGVHVDTSLAAQKVLQCPKCEKAVPDKLIRSLDAEKRAKAERQRMKDEIEKAGCLECPGCQLRSAPPEGPLPAAALCPHCDCSFCPNCQRAPHPGYTCTHVCDKAAFWKDVWLTLGQKHWRENAAAKREREERVQRLLAEQEAHERAMVGQCKMCPQCKASIVRESGCNSVRCGDPTNPYGKGPVDERFGCGARLQWTECPEYAPQHDADARARLEEALAQEQQHVRHGVQCSMCSEEIRGLRFKCLSCPETNLCMECQQKQLGQCPSSAQPAHVFEILCDKEA